MECGDVSPGLHLLLHCTVNLLTSVPLLMHRLTFRVLLTHLSTLPSLFTFSLSLSLPLSLSRVPVSQCAHLGSGSVISALVLRGRCDATAG